MLIERRPGQRSSSWLEHLGPQPGPEVRCRRCGIRGQRRGLDVAAKGRPALHRAFLLEETAYVFHQPANPCEQAQYDMPTSAGRGGWTVPVALPLSRGNRALAVEAAGVGRHRFEPPSAPL